MVQQVRTNMPLSSTKLLKENVNQTSLLSMSWKERKGAFCACPFVCPDFLTRANPPLDDVDDFVMVMDEIFRFSKPILFGQASTTTTRSRPDHRSGFGNLI